MPLDPSIYSQVGKVNLGAGIADELNQFTQQRAAQEDRQNRLAQLAMQMQEHKAQQAALSALTPEAQSYIRLGGGIKDWQEQQNAEKFMDYFNKVRAGVPAQTPYAQGDPNAPLTPSNATVDVAGNPTGKLVGEKSYGVNPAAIPSDTDMSKLASYDPVEYAKIKQGMVSSGLAQPQMIKPTPEQMNDLVAQGELNPNKYVQKGIEGIRKGEQFQQAQQQALELKMQQIEANKPEIVKLQEASQKLRDIGNNTMADQIDSRIELLGQPRNITPEPITTKEIVDPKDPSRNIVVDFRKYDENKYLTKGDKTGILGQAPSNAASTGGREGSQLQRIILATNQVSKDLSNLTNLPLTSSRGIFGGRSQGQGLFEAGKETLTNSMTNQEVRTYNIMATGIQRNLAAIEAAGMMPSGSLTHQMDSLILKEGDSNLSKLQALAQIRQIADAGIETLMSNPRVSKEQKTHMQDIQKNLEKAVPFTQDELNGLQLTQQTNPNVTLGEVMKELKNKQSASTTQNAHPPDIQQMIDANRR